MAGSFGSAMMLGGEEACVHSLQRPLALQKFRRRIVQIQLQWSDEDE